MCHFEDVQIANYTCSTEKTAPRVTSEEWVLGLYPQQWISRITKFVKNCPADSEIILILRDPLEWTRSAASQLLNEGWVRTVEETCSSEGGIQVEAVDYEAVIEVIRAAGVPLHLVHLSALTERTIWERILNVQISEELWKRSAQSGKRYRGLSEIGVRLYRARDRFLERFGLIVLGSQQAFHHFGAESHQARNVITPLSDLRRDDRIRLFPGRALREALYRLGSSGWSHKLSGSLKFHTPENVPISPTEVSLQQDKYMFIAKTQ